MSKEMSRAEWDKMIDEWAEKINSHKGEVTIPKIGPYPTDVVNCYGQQMNQWVTTDAIRHFAASLGDRNPLYWSEDYARTTRWGGIIAPPTFTDYIGIPWTYLVAGGSENTPKGAKYRTRSIPGGARRKWFQVMRPGDKIRIVDRNLGLEEKKSKEQKAFRFFLSKGLRTYINQKDEVVAQTECDYMLLPAFSDPNSVGEALGSRPKPKYTDEARDAILRGYETETRQGASILFWEDIVVGGETKPLVVGPVNGWDTATFLGAGMPGHATAFAINWERLKAELPFTPLDPEINAYKCMGEHHIGDGYGRLFIGDKARGIAYGHHVEALIARMICNWIGDDGFLKRLDTQSRNVPFLGDTYYIKGKVTGKSNEGGEYLVELEVKNENQDGLLLTPGTATVQLYSRTRL